MQQTVQGMLLTQDEYRNSMYIIYFLHNVQTEIYLRSSLNCLSKLIEALNKKATVVGNAVT